jgi:hypothetical protein
MDTEICLLKFGTTTCPSPSHMVLWRQDSRLLFSDTWFIVAKSLLIFLQLLSCLTHHFMSSMYLFLKTFFLWSSCFHMYSILRRSTWSILSWLRSRHKCWTKLIVHVSFLLGLILILQYGTTSWLTKQVDNIIPFAS